MRVVITEKSSGNVIADAREAAVQKVEGNWYVDGSAVDRSHLETTAHDYTCPYKGRCFYVDYVDGEKRVARVAWIYDNPKDGWEHIKGKYGFYAGEAADRIGKTVETITE